MVQQIWCNTMMQMVDSLVDQLHDQGPTSDNAATTGEEVLADNVLATSEDAIGCLLAYLQNR